VAGEDQSRGAEASIKYLIIVAAKLVKHAGKEVLKLARGWNWASVILAIGCRIEAMPRQS